MAASVLTNTSAMVALQTLRNTNSNLEEVNNQISTGKAIATAKDNASIFAISKVMESDVAGFKAVSDSLSLGAATLAVASSATESIRGTLDQIKTKIISANEDNVDKQKLQDEIDSLVAQASGTVAAAQFNGLNLIDGSAGANVEILASLDRDSSGTVTPTKIAVDLTNTNLSTTTGTAVAGVFDAGQTGGNGAASGFSAAIDESGGATDNLNIAFDSGVAPTAGNIYTLEVDGTEFTYTAQAGDDNLAVAYALRDQIEGSGLSVTASVTPVANPGTTDVVLNLLNDDTGGGITISGNAVTAGTGALAGLGSLDVVGDAAGALTAIDGIIDSVIDAQAVFGTAEARVEIQNNFISTLTDSFKSGIGALIDADLEEASARLQALQVQQQLGVQALSIANQAPQTILSLFR